MAAHRRSEGTRQRLRGVVVISGEEWGVKSLQRGSHLYCTEPCELTPSWLLYNRAPRAHVVWGSHKNNKKYKNGFLNFVKIWFSLSGRVKKPVRKKKWEAKGELSIFGYLNKVSLKHFINKYWA